VWLSVAGGAVLIAVIVGDALGTLVVTRQAARWRPTAIWYASTWRMTRVLVIFLPQRAGDFVLNAYPPLSLLGLLLVWLVGLLLGWSLIYWGLGQPPVAGGEWPTTVYYAGTGLFSAAFGTAHGTSAQLLSLVETVMGLGTIALLISYLPALYGAYSRRETKLLTLDDIAGMRITPLSVIAIHTPHSDLEAFYRFCSGWEQWTAEVLESHSSYPMLSVFRSHHAGQSWITALGVVTDAATLACACIENADVREPYFLHRRGQRAIVDISARLGVPREPWIEDWLSRDNFEIAWAGLEKLAVSLRARYGRRLEELIDFLLAPRGFWGHSAEETVQGEVAQATMEARIRARAASRAARSAREPA
jgi:hypothetical protein